VRSSLKRAWGQLCAAVLASSAEDGHLRITLSSVPLRVGCTCGWCGKESWLQVAGDAERPGLVMTSGATAAGVYVCGGCRYPSMVTWTWNALEERWTQFVVLPTPRAVANDDLPEGIREEHKEAHDCLHGGQLKASMLMARAALQHACRSLGAEGRGLKAELDSLVEKGAITRDLRAFADEVRLLGNDVAHPPEDIMVVERDQAEELLEYLDGFLQTTLVLPAKAKRRAKERG